MNYIWDLIVKAKKQGISKDEITFLPAKVCSPYMELAFDVFNPTIEGESLDVEVNPYYRHYEVFKDLFPPGNKEYKEVREIFFDFVMHHIADIESYMGMNHTEFYIRYLQKNIEEGCLGKKTAATYKKLLLEEKEIINRKLLGMNEIGESLKLYGDVIHLLYKNSYLYHNVKKEEEILIYLGVDNTEFQKEKINLVNDLFLPISYHCRIFYKKHFGIIGHLKTMKVGNIQLY